jgi:hypothetical protein
MSNRVASLLAFLALATSCGGSATPAALCAADDTARCFGIQQACSVVEGAAVCGACPSGEAAIEDGTCAALTGTPLHHEFPTQTTSNGQEVIGLCRSWTLGNEEDLWVTALEIEQDELSHHSNWTFVPDTLYTGDDGIWPCADRDYHQLNAAVAGGVIYAQSTQAVHEVQQFPEGAAIRIPAHSRIISDIHLLNLSGATREGNMAITLYSIPRAEVTVPLTPFHIDYLALDIPPHQTSRFTTTCDLAANWEATAGAPLSVRLFYSLPHTHILGSRVFLEAVGGAHDGESLLDVVGQPGEARGLRYTPPIDLSDMTGLRFGCEFENPRAESVGWGFGDQEMCEMLGFIESPLAFEGTVHETTTTGTDGPIATHEGPCTIQFVPWDGH